MPSVEYFNQSAPFWDFVASIEDQGTSHPMFAAFGPQARPGPSSFSWGRHDSPPEGRGFPFQGFPFGPPPPRDLPHHEGSPPPGDGFSGPQGPPQGPPGQEVPPPYEGGHRGERPPHGGRRGRPFHRSRGCGRDMNHNGWNGMAPFMNPFAQFFMSYLRNGAAEEGNADSTGRADQIHDQDGKDFAPPVDVFDTEDTYIVHVSLPGAKKEDVGVNWDADKSELSVAGVIYRPGDEEVLKTLAMDERKIGAFERKVRLGSRAHPAAVDPDTIGAKMEDGVLRISIPKQDKEYVEIKKVDIE